MRHSPQNSFQNLVLLNERTSTVLGNKKFRYGYQGSEMDNEVKGEGNSYNTEFRQLDPRLGRWLTIDPKASSMPWESPYSSMDNNPIRLNDPKGLSTSGDKSKSKKSFNNPSKAADRYIRKNGLEGKVEKVSWSSGVVTLQSSREESDGSFSTVAIARFNGSKSFKRKLKNAQEDEANRKYNNEHSIMGQFYKSTWDPTATIGVVGPDRIADHPEWQAQRDRMNTLNSAMQNYMLAMASLPLGGLGNGGKIVTAFVNSGANYLSQLGANRGNSGEVDVVSVGASGLSAFLPGGSFKNILTSSAVTATVDAVFDYKVNGNYNILGINKKGSNALNDLIWGTAGTAGGMAFGKNPLIMEITGTAVTTAPTVMLNTVTNSVINE